MMIRFRPKRRTPTASLKDELVFENMDEMLRHVLAHWGNIADALGAKRPIMPEDIIISEPTGDDPLICLRNVRTVSVTRLSGAAYSVPMCIGVCGE